MTRRILCVQVQQQLHQQQQRGWLQRLQMRLGFAPPFLPIVVPVVLVVLVILVSASSSSSSSSLFVQANDFEPIRVLNIGHRLRQRCALSQIADRKHHAKSNNKGARTSSERRHQRQGTRFTFRSPNHDRVAAWFGDEVPAENRHSLRHKNHGKNIHDSNPYDSTTTHYTGTHDTYTRDSTTSTADFCNLSSTLSSATAVGLMRAYNHPLVGMTNPILGVEQTQQPKCNSDTNHPDAAKTTRVSSSKSVGNSVENSAETRWWPATACQPLADWRRLRFRQTVGFGHACYHACREAALHWEFSSKTKGMVRVRDANRGSSLYEDTTTKPTLTNESSVVTTTTPCSNHRVQQIWSGPGRKLVTYTSMGWGRFKIHTVNPVRAVYDLVDQRSTGGATYTSTAYGTCPGHLMRGEERVTVVLRHDDMVDVEILSWSRPADSLLGRLVWPLVGGMQRKFFQDQMKHFQRVADDAATTTSTVDSCDGLVHSSSYLLG